MQCSAATDPAALETSWSKAEECGTKAAEHKTQIWSPKATSSYYFYHIIIMRIHLWHKILFLPRD